MGKLIWFIIFAIGALILYFSTGIVDATGSLNILYVRIFGIILAGVGLVKAFSRSPLRV
jgi:hypothetical protein